MVNKFQIIIVSIFIFITVLWNERLIPVRLEIAELEPVRIFGVDYIDEDNVSITIVRENIKDSGGSDSSKEEKSSSDENEAITVTSDTLENAMRGMQLYTTKQVIGDHVKYILIGEEMAKKGLYEVMDFISRDEEFRFNSYVYIVKGSTVEEFAKGQVKSKDLLAEKLTNLERHIDDFGYTSKIRLLNVLNFLFEKEEEGLIPAISLINTENDLNFKVDSSDKDKTEEAVTLIGYAHIKDAKLYEYLSPQISRGCNVLENNLKTAPITITDDEGDKINLDVQRVSTDYAFNFNGDELSKITLNVKIRSNYAHIEDILDIYDTEDVFGFENKQAEFIKSEIEGVMNKIKETNSDYINLLGKLRMKHPYKYEKIKDKWNEILPNLNYEIIVKSEIVRTYDVFDKLKKE